jgi:hypothetical protein
MEMPTDLLVSKGKCFGDDKPDFITVNPLGLTELSMLSEASTLDKHITFVEAILHTMPEVEDYQISIGDLFQLVSFHRSDAFRESPIELNWRCSGHTFTDEEGKFFTYSDIKDKSLEYKRSLTPNLCLQDCHVEFTHEDMDLVYLPNIDIPDGLSLPTAKLYAEYVELSKDPKLAKIIPAAQWISTGTTIHDKIAFLGKQKDLNLFDSASKTNYTMAHGPKNKVYSDCPVCGTQVSQDIVFDQYSFFRN